MKKLWSVAAVILAALMMTSCACSVEGKAEAFAEDMVDLAREEHEVRKEMDEYVNSLSEKDKQLFIETYQKRYKELKKELKAEIEAEE